MVPYLKGFHLTIEMWREGQDAEGWKLPESNKDSLEEFEDEEADRGCHRVRLKQGDAVAYAPTDGFTTTVPWFKDNIADSFV